MTELTLGPTLTEASGSALAVGVFEGVAFADPELQRFGDDVTGHLAAIGFEGKLGQVAWLPNPELLPFDRVLLVGLGSEVDMDRVRRAAGSAGRAAGRTTSVATTMHLLDVEGAAQAFVEGFLLGQYRFNRYQSNPEPAETGDIALLGGSGDDLVASERARIIVEGVALARDLVNEPSLDKAPAVIAKRVRALGSQHGIEVDVYDREKIVAEGFGGLAGVGSGAAREPNLVVARYRPAEASGFVAFVGKGIVFDSGGLSLKTAEAMEPMKTDLAGSAAVLGAMVAIARLGLRVRVMGIMPFTENMPGGNAIRPGDVLRARNGMTIEVTNTDAEGRLVLADGLSLAAEAKPDLIVDMATLTGACRVALGDKIAGLWSNDELARDAVLAAAERAGERIWAMPLPEDYRKNIDSDIADMRNTGSTRYGGAINAALFLKEFVGEVPWVHVDIAGPARATETEHYIPKGGTGFGVRTLIALAEDLAH